MKFLIVNALILVHWPGFQMCLIDLQRNNVHLLACHRCSPFVHESAFNPPLSLSLSSPHAPSPHFPLPHPPPTLHPPLLPLRSNLCPELDLPLHLLILVPRHRPHRLWKTHKRHQLLPHFPRLRHRKPRPRAPLHDMARMRPPHRQQFHLLLHRPRMPSRLIRKHYHERHHLRPLSSRNLPTR